jgi:hypothetical protein
MNPDEPYRGHHGPSRVSDELEDTGTTGGTDEMEHAHLHLPPQRKILLDRCDA